jgi:hypothetical protein
MIWPVARTPRLYRAFRGTFLDDLDDYLEHVAPRLADAPWFFMGHGMGGMVRARLATTTRPVSPSGQGKTVGTPEQNISLFNTQPALSPVNACRNASRRTRHDSGPV